MYKYLSFLVLLVLLVILYFSFKNDDGTFIVVKQSSIPGAGKGVFATRDIEQGVTIGEYTGELVNMSEIREHGKYAWSLRNGQAVDAVDPEKSNWLRYINDHRTEEGNNLAIYEHDNKVYYQTKRPIKKGSELFVSYGENYWKIKRD
jgi:SET domain-containing protein